MQAGAVACEPTRSTSRVLIVDDHSLVRSGLTDLLGVAPDIEVVGSVANGAEAVAAAAALRPDVVLMDLTMPVMDGVDATAAIKAVHGDAVSVIVLTAFHDADLVSRAMVAGAAGYLLKDIEPAVLVSSIRAVRTGGVPLSPAIAAQLLSRRPAAVTTAGGLTQREQEILRLLSAGLPNKQIARALGISDKTVKSHCGRIFQRLGVNDRTQAAVWASRNLSDMSPR